MRSWMIFAVGAGLMLVSGVLNWLEGDSDIGVTQVCLGITGLYVALIDKEQP